ncbi:MAG: bis(5'-nucleosyl)-tetraphosphatase (symmetrical) YqeK [Actinobacteria bacterium]|nr:bis(5'-nucleosyl)-tetraphosphatase (symmetrical) YqeK [Actinomycetota bacterium]
MKIRREIESRLKDALSGKLYKHSLSTAETAKGMAENFEVDAQKAYLTGLLHDCAKVLSDQELLDEARAIGLDVDEVDVAEPYLLHAPVGAHLAREVYGMTDEDVLRAIGRHTLGAISMTPLDKIAYVSDMIEPGRKFPGLDRIRNLAGEDLDMCYAEAYAHTLKYLAEKRKPIHPLTVSAWNSIVLGG